VVVPPNPADPLVVDVLRPVSDAAVPDDAVPAAAPPAPEDDPLAAVLVPALTVGVIDSVDPELLEQPPAAAATSTVAPTTRHLM
jgi:hypothetical protein